MKKIIRNTVLEALGIVTIYTLLLHLLAGTNIVASIFCPGPHLPHYYPALILIFIISRLYVVLLPGIILSRIGLGWIKQRKYVNYVLRETYPSNLSSSKNNKTDR